MLVICLALSSQRHRQLSSIHRTQENRIDVAVGLARRTLVLTRIANTRQLLLNWSGPADRFFRWMVSRIMSEVRSHCLDAPTV